MRPFLRPTERGRLAPVGWAAEPAGQWAGKEVEIVYDPQRHQVLLLRDEPGDATRTAIAGTGYRRIAVVDKQEMWVRDRPAATQERLDRLQRSPVQGHATEVESRSP